MGCDIHALYARQQRHTYSTAPMAYTDHWHVAGEPDQSRNYLFFAALAGVRDYHGVPRAGSTIQAHMSVFFDN